MAVVTMKQLLSAGVHFGHQTRRWNPKMRRFILGERNGIYLIDLRQTMKGIEESYGFVRDLVAGGGTILFVGTKKQTQGPVADYASACGMPYVNERWLGGMLTNFQTVSARVQRMKEFEAMQKAGDFDAMPKKEALRHTRELEKLQRNLGGIRALDKLPDAIFVIDTKKEHIAVTEANKLGMPVVAVVDTNCDPDVITYVIPGNDDAIRSGALLCRVVADAVVEGRYIAQQRPAAPAAGRSASRLVRCPSRRPRVTPTATATPRHRRCHCPEPISPRRRSGTGGCVGLGTCAAATALRRERRRTPPKRRRRPRRQRPPTPLATTGDHRQDGDDRVDERHRARRSDVPPFSTKDVQRLRQVTSVGILDAKRALEENEGDFDRSITWLREQGLASQAKRADREAAEGAVAIGRTPTVASIVQLRSETDFVAKSDEFVSDGRRARPAGGREGRGGRGRAGRGLEDMRTTLKENISIGQVVRIEQPAEGALDSYLHMQAGRGVNAVVVALSGGTTELAHDIATHIAFARPTYVSRDDVPADEVAAEQETVEKIARNEGKPDAALPRSSRGACRAGTRSVSSSTRPMSRTRRRPSPSCSAPPGWSDSRRSS